MPEIEEFFTVAELSKILKMKPYTVRIWIRDKVIIAVKLGGEHGDWRIPKSEVQRLVDEAYGRREA